MNPPHNSKSTLKLKLNFIDREKLDLSKKNLLNKILRDLDNKYKILIAEKGFKFNESLSKNLLKLIDEFYDFNNPQYVKFFNYKVEKFFLSKMSKIEDKRIGNLPERKEIQSLLNKK